MENVSFSACRRIVPFRRGISRLLLTAACSMATAAQAAPLPTATTLTLSSSSVASLTEITLTAAVTAGGAPVATGSITFCDLSAYTRCEDAAVVGRAQLNGMPPTATLKYFPRPGSINIRRCSMARRLPQPALRHRKRSASIPRRRRSHQPVVRAVTI